MASRGTRRGHGSRSASAEPGVGAGCWVVLGAAGNQLGPGRLPGGLRVTSLPGLSRLPHPQRGVGVRHRSRLPRRGRAIPPRRGLGGTRAGSPRQAGSPSPRLGRREPCGARAEEPAAASPRERRRGEAGAGARWSRLRAAIFLGGEGWGEMDAVTRGGATAGECQPRGGERQEREPSPSPSLSPLALARGRSGPGPGPRSISASWDPSLGIFQPPGEQGLVCGWGSPGDGDWGCGCPACPHVPKGPRNGDRGSWVGWAAWERAADGGGKLRHRRRKGAVLTQPGAGGLLANPLFFCQRRRGRRCTGPEAGAKRSPRHRGAAASPASAGSCPWGSRTPCPPPPAHHCWWARGLSCGFLDTQC